MDATTRWETEALRDGNRPRPSPPRPTKAQRASSTNWVTLKDAEAATGIPVNTLRKWVRRSGLPSYLESDGELELRMVDLDAVQRRARELGRETNEQSTRQPVSRDQPTVIDEAAAGAPAKGTGGGSEPRQAPPARPPAPESPAWEPETRDPQQTTNTGEAPDASGADTATMMVPVDAWNKMLTQLGNLHEAGQQLAEARERAAKAETEAMFLRERLSELREAPPIHPAPITADESLPVSETTAEVGSEETSEAGGIDTEPQPTTTYWRYLTTGWRERRRRSGD